MSVTRVSDAGTFAFLQTRTQKIQLDIRRLQDQLVSGQRILSPEDDPLAAAQVLRHSASLAALAQHQDGSAFGVEVLHAEDEALEEGNSLLVRAEEIASQQASGLYSAAQRAAAAEEVHGILEALTRLGNSELAGRRLFSNLTLHATAPFTDPNAPGYTAATAYVGSTQEFEVKIGSASGDRVRLTTRGDTVFTNSLTAVEALETQLTANGNVAGTLTALGTARDGIATERASVGSRQAQLQDRVSQVRGLTATETTSRGKLRDADFTVVATQLVQAQNALQALLAAATQIKDTSLSGLLRL